MKLSQTVLHNDRKESLPSRAETIPPLPEKFPFLPGAVFPLYYVLEVTGCNLDEQAQVRRLDETNAVATMEAPEGFRRQPGEMQQPEGEVLPLSLRPYAVGNCSTVMPECHLRSGIHWRAKTVDSR
jgi:hypothetical protein